MGEESPSRTDTELLGLLDEPGGWMVRAGATAAAPQGSLRQTLRQAFNLSVSGQMISHIVKLPDDAIVVSAAQIHRLWQRLGLLDS